MPEGESDDADTSKSFVKDLDNIKRMDFLLQVDFFWFSPARCNSSLLPPFALALCARSRLLPPYGKR